MAIIYFEYMARYDELPVYKASYDLFLEIFRFVKDFEREYKYTIGESLKKETLDLVILIYKINGREEKDQVLSKSREKVETVRLIVRLTKDLHQVNTRKFILLNKRLENVSKQLTGWQKSLKV